MTILFATNRVFNEGPTPILPDGTLKIPRQVSFNLNNNQAEQSIYFCERTSQDNYREIGHREFFKQLDEVEATEILFYIHGYSSLPEQAVFRRTQELQQLFDLSNGKQVLVVPLIWPCDNDLGLVKDYFDDQKAADASDMSFMRFFEMFFRWLQQRLTPSNPPFNKKLHILTQSMGARVLVGATNRAVDYYQLNGFPQIFNNIFLAAPDIVNEALEPNKRGQWIPVAANNVIVYHASDDWALRTSIAANVFNIIASRRLGQRGPEDMNKVPRNVFALNCSGFNSTYDTVIGHRYFGSLPGETGRKPGLLFEHMQLCIEKEKVIIPSNQRRAILNRELLDNN